MGEAKKHKIGAWLELLSEGAEKRKTIRFETKDGGNRSGRLTGLRKQEMRLNGRRCEIITHLELNGDNTDAVPFFNIRSLDIFDD